MRDVEKIRRLVLAGSPGEKGEWTSRLIHGSWKWGHRRKLRIDELYAMYLAKKPYNQLTKLDKEMAREDLARKVLRYYFSSSWGRGYFELLQDLEEFYDKFPKAGRDKVTFVRFIRSLSLRELKVVFTADPETLFKAVLWLQRHKGRARMGGAFSEFYQRVLKAVSEMNKDKWSKKLVKAVFRLVEEFKPQKGEEDKPAVAGKKGLGFYDYLALYLAKECHVAPVTAFTAAVLTARHVIAEYFFDPKVSYRYRLFKIKEHFKPLFKEYPEAERLLDDYFIRSVVNSMTWQDLVRFVGADIEKLKQYYHKNKHKLGLGLGNKLFRAITDYVFLNEEELRKWWREHNQALLNITSLAYFL